MKRIRGPDAPIPGLSAYLECEGAGANWDGFRSHEAGAAHRELLEILVESQHGLCGYCEIDLLDQDRQIEHVIPQSDPNYGAERTLDVHNLIACCKGGTSKNEFGPEALDDVERFLRPLKRNISCGEKKGGSTDSEFVDPRTLPALPTLTRVGYDGQIEADRSACQEADFPIDAVKKTIQILGLNVERLRRAREKRWRALNDNWQEHDNDDEIMAEAARMELLPETDNRLFRFFTTSRSYFAPWCEGILAEKPREWI